MRKRRHDATRNNLASCCFLVFNGRRRNAHVFGVRLGHHRCGVGTADLVAILRELRGEFGLFNKWLCVRHLKVVPVFLVVSLSLSLLKELCQSSLSQISSANQFLACPLSTNKDIYLSCSLLFLYFKPHNFFPWWIIVWKSEPMSSGGEICRIIARDGQSLRRSRWGGALLIRRLEAQSHGHPSPHNLPLIIHLSYLRKMKILV